MPGLKNGELDGSRKDFEDILLLQPLDSATLEMHAFAREKGTLDDFYKRFKDPVDKILRSRKGRKAIKALSTALLNTGTLSGFEAVTILEKSWGQPLPDRAKLAHGHCALKTNKALTYGGLLQSLKIYLRIMIEDINNNRGEYEDCENDHIGKIRHWLVVAQEMAEAEKPLKKESSK